MTNTNLHQIKELLRECGVEAIVQRNLEVRNAATISIGYRETRDLKAARTALTRAGLFLTPTHSGFIARIV